MTIDIAITLSIAIIATVLFATEKMRMDAVAILVLASLALFGQISPQEALSGFSNSATITVTAMFVLAAGLQISGALDGIGALLGRVKSPLAFLLVLFAIVSLISPFVNNTAVVAVFIPIVIAAAKNIKFPASKALIPLSFVSQMAGVTTLIGTSTNLLVNSIAQQQGHRGFGMFEFFPLGIIFLIIGYVYLLTAGRWLLPDNSAHLIDERQDLGKYVAEWRVSAESPLVGKTIADAVDLNLYIIGVLRDGERLSTPSQQVLQRHDILLVRGLPEELLKLRDQFALKAFSVYAHQHNSDNAETQWVIAEVMVAPNSQWIGGNVALLSQRWNRNSTVVGIQRRSKIVRERLRRIHFHVGDILLMILPKEDIADLRRNQDFIILSENHERKKTDWRAHFAIGVMIAVITASAVGIVPITITALIGAVLMVCAGCLSAEEAYASIDWRIIILLAGLLPLGAAMNNSGAAAFIVEHTLGRFNDASPLTILAILYLMTMVLTELMSNAGTAVLMTPIAVSTANMLDINASPLIIAVMFAAATSFMTPVGYQTNTMVYGAGGYRFTDFIKIGLPLNLLYWVLGILFIPMIWPFS
ncbi:Na(+)/dicarboxylate symporter [Brevundimonas vesicularis]|uniref:Na(+)/dicarboxylate symporter n=2 Tax=Brevundimonas vesicularis TaxID=41276 RepID=A0A2X1BLT5_BREVE|nr:Na(+)/dicarboxylate symporter [Brevundimonas vesicularis]